MVEQNEFLDLVLMCEPNRLRSSLEQEGSFQTAPSQAPVNAVNQVNKAHPETQVQGEFLLL